MGKGATEEWDEMPKPPPPMTTQPQSYEDTSESPKKKRGCPKCCLKTRDCLMSPECGRALQIGTCVAFCGSCIRMWV